ncbi:MAG: hypothetical protein EPN20_15225 [Magnetospirillum sp.]|nr:MAG: hypothetical protein EPN20_15225 [Magnetospirillum sp.]
MRTIFIAIMAAVLTLVAAPVGWAQGYRLEATAKTRHQWLVTPEEASHKAPATRTILAGKSDPGGPRLVIRSPGDIKEIRSPVTIDVAFTPQDGTTVDLSSLKVTYIAFVDIDITRRLAPYLGISGIHADAAELPPGEHDIEISIRDNKGRRSAERLSFKVIE